KYQRVINGNKSILPANEERLSNQEIATRVGTTTGKVTKWTKRWI
ncbi:MAG: hypothetical protein, partial [Olavius algarvensis Gamma 1 endosymbiont]